LDRFNSITGNLEVTSRGRKRAKIAVVLLAVFALLNLLLYIQERSATSAALRDVLVEAKNHRPGDGRSKTFFLGKVQYTAFWSNDIEESLLQELTAEFDTCNFKLMKASQAPFDTVHTWHGYLGELVIAGPITSWGIKKLEVQVFTYMGFLSASQSTYKLTRTGFNSWVVRERRIETIS
jgi:hypothetical protein